MRTSDTNSAITAGLDWVPSACTLPTVEQPLRVAEFDDLFSASVTAAERVDATTLRLTLGGDEDRARELADRESSCCSFFGFTFAPADDGAVAMTVTVPPAHVAVLDAFAARATTAAGLPAVG